MPARLTKSSWCGIAPVLALPELLTIRRKQPLLEQASAQRLALTEGDIAKVRALAQDRRPLKLISSLSSTNGHSSTLDSAMVHQY